VEGGGWRVEGGVSGLVPYLIHVCILGFRPQPSTRQRNTDYETRDPEPYTSSKISLFFFAMSPSARTCEIVCVCVCEGCRSQRHVVSRDAGVATHTHTTHKTHTHRHLKGNGIAIIQPLPFLFVPLENELLLRPRRILAV
jgi:hypothetical protein